MRKTLFNHHFESVVGGIGNGIFGENIAKHRYSVHRTSRTGRKRGHCRIAIRRGIWAQPHEVEGLTRTVDNAAVGHVERKTSRNSYAPLRVLFEGTALQRASK